MNNLSEANLIPPPHVYHNSARGMGGTTLGLLDQPSVPVAPEETFRPKHPIRIEQLDFGYVLHVGCKDFAFETQERMIANLDAYLIDPVAAENNWNKTKTLPA